MVEYIASQDRCLLNIEANYYNQLDIEENYTVLKVAHHGSNYSSSEKFLKKVNPKYSIISVGKNNSYGHPGNETRARLPASTANSG